MSAELIIRPGETLRSWDEFITKNPKGYVIALDGYLNEPPGFKRVGYKSPAEPGGPYSNLDHHTGVDRLATLSSAQQALRAVRLGLVDAYTNKKDGEYQAKVFVNDPDQDVILAWHILQDAPFIASHRLKKEGASLRNFVDMAGDLDATAGAYPQPLRLSLMRQIAWVFRPYTEARARGELTGDASHYREIIEKCCGRIALHLDGRGKEAELDTRYKDIGGGEDWRMFQEIGAEGRLGAFRDGIKAFVIYKGQREDGRHDYSLGRISEYINFNLHLIIDELNQREGLVGSSDHWGCDGSGIIGGSPRGVGSGVAPEELIEIINAICEYSQQQSGLFVPQM